MMPSGSMQGRRLITSDWQRLDDALDMHQGYVLDFSDRTMAEFMEARFGLDLHDPKYTRNGSSKARRLREFVRIGEAGQVSRVLRALWTLRCEEGRFVKADAAEEARIRGRFFELIGKIEGDDAVIASDVFEKFDPGETLAELVDGIQRDLDAGRPAAGLDRLHTYCMKRFAHLLRQRGETCDKNEPLHSRVGRYIGIIEREAQLTEMTLRMLKSGIKIFDRFNAVRNDRSLAHDNELVAKAEARFVFESVAAILRFFKAIDAAHFGD